ncbi:flavin-containing monooxygenase FMO GS-OX-like 2 [Anopheles albimanus]|uniref:flavin-containing monooxygenase FMO GS-OX-like 2 n=1 Tax=Anopheles albimanus TaxID=7167 RepID=UPI00164006C4|nr:flavin-containing monooxygenase FMO GS-OX-like 2 [Anopheles albimanus]
MAKRYCIIGAGTSGVCAAKTVLEAGGEVTVYERTDQIGGTWVYTDDVGTDRYGLPVHTSMYQGLKTNLPKEIMGFPGYEMAPQDASYVRADEVLSFIRDYTNHYGVTKYIRFEHLVEEVKPDPSSDQGRWRVKVRNLREASSRQEYFDFVLVCNGHYHTPYVPSYPGRADFLGHQLHSHDYRKPDVFKDHTVLVIGAGPSGTDLTLEAARLAKTVYFSHHVPDKLKHLVFPANVVQVPDVVRISTQSVEFANGASYPVTLIFYCTGYRYSFPFLHEDCGVQVDDNWVHPLYKHVLSITHPTMAFIGLPFYVCATLMFELQARFCVAFYSGRLPMPTREEMERDHEREMAERWNRGLKKRQAHMMGPDYQGQYYRSLADRAQLVPIPEVMTKIHVDSGRRKKEDLEHYRNDVYRIVDDDTFAKCHISELETLEKELSARLKLS